MIKYDNCGVKNWDAHFTVPTFDFYFKVAIPRAQKGRVIVQRDSLGRILSSQVI
jgi:hypothetical protein